MILSLNVFLSPWPALPNFVPILNVLGDPIERLEALSMVSLRAECLLSDKGADGWRLAL